MEMLGADEEEQLLDDVKRAVDLVDDAGLAPDAAIEKVARERGYGAGKIRLLACAYNTGRQTAQRTAERSVLDKLAAFPLADPEAIVAARYGPAERAASVSEDYGLPPDWLAARARQKAAAADPPPPLPATEPHPGDRVVALRRAEGAIERAKQARDRAVQDREEAHDQVQLKVAQLVRYFAERPPADRLPFALVEKAAAAYLGPRGDALLGLVYAQARLDRRFAEKRGAECRDPRPVDLAAAPFTTLAAGLAAAARHAEAAGRVKRAEAALATAREGLRPFTPAGAATTAPRPAAEPPSLWSAKAAGLFAAPALGAAVGSALTRGLSGAAPKSRDELIDDAWLDLEDPGHQNELRKIQANAMLNSLMTDEDDPISAHSPDEVLQAYNELAQLAPRAATQPAVMKPLLRRRLAGQFEPFESKELAEIEKNLAENRQSTPHTSVLSNAPKKLLG